MCALAEMYVKIQSFMGDRGGVPGGAGAAVVAGDQDVVRETLHHARGDHAHTHLRHQLDRDTRLQNQHILL